MDNTENELMIMEQLLDKLLEIHGYAYSVKHDGPGNFPNVTFQEISKGG